MPGYNPIVVYFVSCLSLSCCLVCSLQTCSSCVHLLEKDDLLALMCVMFSCVLSHSHMTIWWPGSDVVLNCIDSWSLPTSLLSRFIAMFSSLIRDGKAGQRFSDDPGLKLLSTSRCLVLFFPWLNCVGGWGGG